jgi:hypothetical protein
MTLACPNHTTSSDIYHPRIKFEPQQITKKYHTEAQEVFQ